jgi:hypothetical protein
VGLAAAIIGTLALAATLFAWCIAAAVQAADDLAHDEANGDWPFVPRACGCVLSLGLCDSRCCPTHSAVASPSADASGDAFAGRDRIPASVSTPSHTAGDMS